MVENEFLLRRFANKIILLHLAEEAMPALRAAEKALQELNRNDVVEVKAMKKPPAGVVLVIESLCVVFDIKPIKVCRKNILMSSAIRVNIG